MRHVRYCIAILAIAIALAGCRAAQDPIPVYALRPSGESLDVIRQRSAQIHDISGQGDITLTNAAGNSTALDGVFVFAPPDRARVRAYKFGQAVLDLTITPDGSWLFLARSDEHAGQLRSGSNDIGHALRQWLILLADPVGGADVSFEETPTQLIVHRSLSADTNVICMIDRATLTPREYRLLDRQGNVRFTLRLDAYRVVGPTVWPTQIRAISPTGTIAIDLHDLSADVAPARAFDHPARAERLP